MVVEDDALAIARELSRRGVRCRLTRATPRDYGLLIPLHNGKQAVWDLHRGTLEARVLRDDGALIGYVPLRTSGDATADQLADLVAQQRYERLSLTGRSGYPSDPGRGAGLTPAGGTRPPGRQGASRARAATFLVVLLAATLLTMLLLYVLRSGA